MAREYLSYDEAEESCNNAWMWLYHYFFERLLDNPDYGVPDNILNNEEAVSDHLEDLHSYVAETLDQVLSDILQGRTNWTVNAQDLPKFSRAMKQYKAANDWMKLNDPRRHERRREAESRKAALAAK